MIARLARLARGAARLAPLLALLPAALLAPAPVRAAEPAPAKRGVQWLTEPLPKVLARAKAENKLVLLDAWARWCQPCLVMDREIWSRDELARGLAREVVPVKVEVDRSTGVGREVGEKYGIYTLPHILVIDASSGEALERMEGVQQAGAILAAVDRARAAASGAKLVEQAGADSAALVQAAARLIRAEKYVEARAALQKAAALDPDCRRDDADDAALLLADIAARTNDRAAGFAGLERAVEACPDASGTAEIWDRLVALAPEAGGADAVGRVLARRAERYPSDADAALALGRFLLDTRKDAAAAESPAKHVVELDPEDPRGLALLAEVKFAQGRTDEARGLLDRAIRIDPQDPDLRELRLRFARARQGS